MNRRQREVLQRADGQKDLVRNVQTQSEARAHATRGEVATSDEDD